MLQLSLNLNFGQNISLIEIWWKEILNSSPIYLW